MFIGFLKACRRIRTEAIPALLKLHQVSSVQALPSSLRMEVEFLESLITYLTQNEAQDSNHTKEMEALVAAVKLFFIRFPGPASVFWNLLLSEKANAVDCFVEGRCMQTFLSLLLNKARNELTPSTIIARAFKHYNELLKLQLLACYKHAHSIQTADKTKPQMPGEALFKEDVLAGFLFAQQPKQPQAQVFQTQLHMLSEGLSALDDFESAKLFLKKSYQHLESAGYPDGLKACMLDGVLRLVQLNLSTSHLGSKSMNSLSDVRGYFKWAQTSVRRQKMDKLEQWFCSYAALLFLKANLFKQANPEKGFLAVPLFGLSDGEIWQYFQQALSMLEWSAQLCFSPTDLPSTAYSRSRFHLPKQGAEQQEAALLSRP